jgi:homoaconitase/3-isopropylmalate dehydratase large subunit
MTSDVILQYKIALQRLVENKPNILPLGSKITINNVALEAGRGKGSIRKDRECFDELREKINAAADKQKKEDSVKPNKASEKLFKDLYHQSLARELMLISQIDELEKDLSVLSNVTNIATQKEKNRKAAEK